MLPRLLAASGSVLVLLDWPALTPALTEIRLFGFSSCLGASVEDTAPSWVGGLAALWLFSSRRQAHFLLEPPQASVLMPKATLNKASNSGLYSTGHFPGPSFALRRCAFHSVGANCIHREV